MHINNCIYPLLINAARKTGIPVIVHLRGHVDCSGPDRRAYEHIFRLIAPTQKVYNYAINTLRFPKDRIDVIHNSVNVKSFCSSAGGILIRKQYDISDDSIVISMFARIIYMKGQIVLTKAIVNLLNQNRDIVCMFVGDESDSDGMYLKEIVNFIKSSGYNGKFIFTGYQNNIQDYYGASDIIIHPSIEDEAFGRIIIEAWAAKKPIIASNIAASKELINDKINGILVNIADVTDLTLAISTLCDDLALRESLAVNGFKKVNNDFTSEAITKKIEAVYNSAIPDAL